MVKLEFECDWNWLITSCSIICILFHVSIHCIVNEDMFYCFRFRYSWSFSNISCCDWNFNSASNQTKQNQVQEINWFFICSSVKQIFKYKIMPFECSIQEVFILCITAYSDVGWNISVWNIKSCLLSVAFRKYSYCA